jgi:hypothetical protein
MESKTDCNRVPQSQRQIVIPVTDSKTDCNRVPQSQRQIVIQFMKHFFDASNIPNADSLLQPQNNGFFHANYGNQVILCCRKLSAEPIPLTSSIFFEPIKIWESATIVTEIVSFRKELWKKWLWMTRDHSRIDFRSLKQLVKPASMP